MRVHETEIFLTPPQVHMHEHNYTNVDAGALEVNGCVSLYVYL